MIKLFTLNEKPDEAGVMTPRTGVKRLTVSVGTGLKPFPTLPPGNYGGAIEIASYENIETMLTAHGFRTLTDFKAKSRGFRWFAWENVIIDGAQTESASTVKLTALFGRKAGMSRASYLAYYPTIHAPLVRKTPELHRYVQNYIFSDDEATFDRKHDGIAELWWPDWETAVRSWSSKEIQVEQGTDVQNFLSPDHSIFLFGNERRLV